MTDVLPPGQGWDRTVLSEPLIVYILKERLESGGPFKAYVDALPEHFDDHPLYWSPDDYNVLGPDTKLARYCRVAQETLMASFERLSKAIAKVSMGRGYVS